MAKARGPGKMAGIRSASPGSCGMEAEEDRLCSESETRNRASALSPHHHPCGHCRWAVGHTP